MVSCNGAGTTVAGEDAQDLSMPAAPGGACTASCSLTGPVQLKEPITVDGVTKPISVAGPVKVITADTDAGQIMTKYNSFTTGGEWSFMLDGPLVFTDISPRLAFDGQSLDIRIAYTMGDCYAMPAKDAVPVVQIDTLNERSLHGVRLNVPAGAHACVNTRTPFVWSGFKPY